MSDAGQEKREWRFYIQDMIEFSGKERTWNIQPS